MTRKKKIKPAATKKQNSKRSRAKSESKGRIPAKKQKQEPEVLPVLNAEKLKELYATMVKCRMLAEWMQGDCGGNRTGNSVFGFEATLVGAGAHLLLKDCIAMEYSSFVVSLIKGTPLPSILARNRESRFGNRTAKTVFSKHGGKAVASLSMETVLVLAAEMKGQAAVTLAFFMQHPETLIFDSATMAIAATLKLPLVCLVESSPDSPLELPSHGVSSPYMGADPAFYPRIPVDGGDVVAVFRVAQEAIRRAREGHGPAVIECLTTRSRRKSGDDRDPAQYLAQDPLSFMENYLRRRNLWPDEWPQSIIQAFNAQLTEAASSLKSPADSESLSDNVYSHFPAATSVR